MLSLRRLIPSADRLIVFEASGRLLSFTAAGAELGMSQAAVSYAIRALEDDLGVQLFRRQHRKVALTDAGNRFFYDVSLGLSHIRKSIEDLRAHVAKNHVTLAASTAFASFWMMPLLQRFRDDNPDIDLRIQTSERDLDIRTEGIALAIRGGTCADWSSYHCELLADEEIFVVASPAYRQTHGLPETVQDIAAHHLIHLEEPYRDAITWKDWLANFEISAATQPRGLLINDYALVIQAAMEGQGIALGWQHLTTHLLRAGLLERITDQAVKTGRGFYVIWPKESELSDPAIKVRDWLIAQALKPAPTKQTPPLDKSSPRTKPAPP